MQKLIQNGRIVFVVGGVVYFKERDAIEARDGGK